jgi:hypothetical protein
LLRGTSGRAKAGYRVQANAVRRRHLEGIDNGEIIDTVHARRAPMIPRQRIAPALKTRTKNTRSSRKVALAAPPFARPPAEVNEAEPRLGAVSDA